MDNSENMKIKINIDKKDLIIDNEKFHKMVLLYNAINEGWSIKKRKDLYIFTKNHEGKKEVLHDSYLNTFMKTNFDIKTIV